MNDTTPTPADARMAGLLDSAMDGIITVDDDQRIVLYNRAAERIFGWTAAELLGQPLDVLIPERFRGAHLSHVRRFGDTGVTMRRMGGGNVISGLRRGGEEFPMEASISQLQTAEGRLFTVILRDITERVRAQQDLAAYAAQANAIREQEKTRVARELHDELAQSLTAIKMDAIWVQEHLRSDPQAAARKLGEMLAMVDTSVAATRRIAADLRPLVLDDLGLGPAIDWLAQNFRQRHGIACEFEGDEDLDLPEPHASAVFRMVQESLANVAKHARASRVTVYVAREGDRLHLRVRDDGAGFDTSQARKPGSLGLAGLRERAQLLQGHVEVRSTPGEGTTVEAALPLPGGAA